ncbi:jg12032, partial [Pararge aegeria aegeria]
TGNIHNYFNLTKPSEPRVGEKRNIIRTVEIRRGKLIGHLLRDDEFITNIIEGKVDVERGDEDWDGETGFCGTNQTKGWGVD